MTWSFLKKRNKKRVYLDYAAATPLDREVLQAMDPYWSKHSGNPGGLHEEGRTARAAVSDAREHIARALEVSPDNQIIFTGSGTEGNSLAILGYTGALEEQGELSGAHVVTSAAEHPSVRDCAQFLEKKGAHVDVVPFNEQGLVDPKELRKLLKKETRFVSISYVNNEIGTLQPIVEIAKEIRAHEKETGAQVVFHTDASQAPLYFDCRPDVLGVDLMTIDGQKLYGPKGVGFLYRKRAVPLVPIMKGGGQEFGLRPGTENTPHIIGMKESFLRAVSRRDRTYRETKELQDHFIAELEVMVPRAVLNGDRVMRSPGIVNVSILGIDNEYLVIALNEAGIAVATKSACLGHGQGRHSYVVASLGGEGGELKAKSALRFSFGKGITKKDLSYAVSVLAREVAKFDNANI